MHFTATGYWAIRGLGAPLRMMCEYTNTTYECKMYDLPERPEKNGFNLNVWLDPKEELKAKVRRAQSAFMCDDRAQGGGVTPALPRPHSTSRMH